jgi:lipoprotein-releasing system permease protein
LSEGTLTLQTESNNYAVIGSLVQSSLGIELNQELNYLQIYAPRKSGSTNPAEQFTIKTIAPSGVLKMQKQLDPIVLLPIGFARELMEEEENVSALELSVQTSSVYAIQEELSANLGSKFIVKNRAQQNQLLYKILNSEKSAVFLILTFVLIIAIFNIIGSLTMLVMDKRKDVAILKSMGANDTLVRRIFFSQGMMISMAGCVSGMLTGLLFCLLQQQYGFIKMEDVTLIADNSYPIILKWQDFVLIFFTVSLISVAASSIASRLSIKNAVDLKENL